MTYPNFPHINPEITLTRADAINLLLSAVAIEELSLTQILAAEGEKMKYALGTLQGAESLGVSMEELMTIDQSVKGTLDTAIRLEMLLQTRLETLLQVSDRLAKEQTEVRTAASAVRPSAAAKAEDDEEEPKPSERGVAKAGLTQGTQLSQVRAFGANTEGPDLEIEEEGTEIALPHNQLLQGVFVDDSNAVFIVSSEGHYVVTYSVHLTEPQQISARLVVNGSGFAPSVIGTDHELSSFHNTVIVPLEPGDTLSLQLFDYTGEATLMAGAGATLTIVKLQ